MGKVRVKGLKRAMLLSALVAAGCGGGTGNEDDSGVNKTYLRVEATDPDGDTLSYQWRVTAGRIDNANARETVWTMPDGPGLHFAYVLVSDGRGGFAEQQYAVTTDALGTRSASPVSVGYPHQNAHDAHGVVLRARVLVEGGSREFRSNGEVGRREVYLPDVQIQVSHAGRVFSAVSDINGEVNLPAFARAASSAATGDSAPILCSMTSGAAPSTCGDLLLGRDPRTPEEAQALSSKAEQAFVASGAGNNIRVHGHVELQDGAVCGTQNEFFGVQSTSTVQMFQAGAALTPPRRVNRFGDYAVEAPGLVGTAVELEFKCGAYTSARIAVAPGGGFLGGASTFVEPHVIPNTRPTIVRVTANGPEGSVRGRMVVPESGAISNSLPGSAQFLAYKGMDNALSACKYYESIGAAASCDPQGRMQAPVSFDEWKRANGFDSGNTEYKATYINERDLNLVRLMVGTQRPDGGIAFYVCNTPGPERRTQAEVDELIRLARAGERRVACVAMEWTRTDGVNNGQPFTKFLTFGPDGSLIPSVNLDGRGEKYMPGACVACHGGTEIGGRFPDSGRPSPLLGARFLPFDTGNYVFSTESNLTEVAQAKAFRDLNSLVVATELSASSPTSLLVQGWYQNSLQDRQDPDYVALSWRATPDSSAFYSKVIARSCRTCHVALGTSFDWEGIRPNSFKGRVESHVCGGKDNLFTNASMPNALASWDRLAPNEMTAEGEELARLMTEFLGCAKPTKDPVHARR